MFLDEVGEMPLSLQVKLLRVLDERKVLRVGGLRKRPIDVRFIAATNRNLKWEVRQKRFRQDLLFRLNGVLLQVPPLRKRRKEIVPLAELFLRRAAIEAKRDSPPRLSAEAARLLQQYDWPGNVRQLKNVMERAALMCPQAEIQAYDLELEDWSLSGSALSEGNEGDGLGTDMTLRIRGSEEEVRIRKALDICGGNQTQAAIILGISRRALGYKMVQYGIPRPRG